MDQFKQPPIIFLTAWTTALTLWQWYTHHRVNVLSQQLDDTSHDDDNQRNALKTINNQQSKLITENRELQERVRTLEARLASFEIMISRMSGGLAPPMQQAPLPQPAPPQQPANEPALANTTDFWNQ